MEQGEMGAETTKPSGQSPLRRIILFLVLATLTSLFSAIMGVAIAWAWLSFEHEMPLAFSQIPPEHQFAISASVISASYPPLILLTFAFMRRTSQGSLESFGLTRSNWLKDLVLGTLIGASFVAFMFAIYALTNLVRFEPVPRVNWGRWLAMSLWLCPLIGFTEELVFRGYLLSEAERWKGRKFAVAFTSVLFWLAHIGQGNVHEPLGALGTLILSATFALARYFTGGLWFPIGFHAGYDWVAFCFGGDIGLGFPTLTEFKPNVPPWLVGPPGHIGVLDLVFYLVMLLGVMFLMPKVWREKGISTQESQEKQTQDYPQ
ncbi:MAG: CPBP family intramembrane metalloprotease [Armatimonadetes bacterium]|nr:CPBP family intramembrane metalloprotease [Armatimonadota bacterium]